MPDVTQPPAVRRFGAFEINLQSGELRKSGMRLRLSGQPFHVLTLLVERAGEVVTREELHSKLWPADTFVDFDHGLNNAVARIRELLDDSSETPRYVETVPRRGYRFIAPLIDVTSATSSSTAELTPSPAEKVTPSPSSVRSTLSVTRGLTANRLSLLLAAAVLAVLAAGLLLYREVKSTRQPDIHSLAVLPLKNLSGDPAQEYFADGMTEELIGRLSMIRGLRVVSRTSVMGFKDSRMTIPEIAKVLHVDALVEGSVKREGVRIRVHAQLIRAVTDEHFWSETYDREIRDALALEGEVAQSIAEKVAVTVTGDERARLVAARHVEPEVYESYLKGLFMNGEDRASVEESILHFEDAIRRDPTFAPAYVGLASGHDKRGSTFTGGAPVQEEREKAISAARKALQLNGELPEAHDLLAKVLWKQWQWAEAEAEYKRALELKANDATAYGGYADWLLSQGRIEQALAWAQRGRELDPVAVSGNDIAWIFFQARRYDEAIRELHSVLAVHPDDARALWILGFALIGNGQAQEAIPPLQKTASITHRTPGSLELLATAYAHSGRRTEALHLIDELKQRQRAAYVPASAFLNPYLALGDYDQAFVWFGRAYREKSAILLWLKVHPFFDPVRKDPRFADLLQRVGLD